MRKIDRASIFKRDFKRVKASPRHRKDVDSLVSAVVELLLLDQALPESNRDHALGGDWSGYREGHNSPDLLLIYRKPDADTLRRARIGSHSELFGRVWQGHQRRCLDRGDVWDRSGSPLIRQIKKPFAEGSRPKNWRIA